ncbi:MAG: hypothetical protein MJ245_02545 [Clostridia bacterium]|nr:hypothetical protein [Clostridia bacterium]
MINKKLYKINIINFISLLFIFFLSLNIYAKDISSDLKDDYELTKDAIVNILNDSNIDINDVVADATNDAKEFVTDVATDSIKKSVWQKVKDFFKSIIDFFNPNSEKRIKEKERKESIKRATDKSNELIDSLKNKSISKLDSNTNDILNEMLNKINEMSSDEKINNVKEVENIVNTYMPNIKEIDKDKIVNVLTSDDMNAIKNTFDSSNFNAVTSAVKNKVDFNSLFSNVK